MSGSSDGETKRKKAAAGSAIAGVAAGFASGIGGAGMLRTAPAAAEAIAADRHSASTAQGEVVQAAVASTLTPTGGPGTPEPLQLPDLSSILQGLQASAAVLTQLSMSVDLTAPAAPESAGSSGGAPSDANTEPSSTGAAQADGSQELAGSEGEPASLAQSQQAIQQQAEELAQTLAGAGAAHLDPQLVTPAAEWIQRVTATLDDLVPLRAEQWPTVQAAVLQGADTFASGLAARLAEAHGALAGALDQAHAAWPALTQQAGDDWASRVTAAEGQLRTGLEDVQSRIEDRMRDLDQHARERVKRLESKVKDEVVSAIEQRIKGAVSEHLVQTGVAASANAAIAAFAPGVAPFLEGVKIAQDAKELAEKLAKGGGLLG
jgi:hypothetical protein